MSMTKSEEDMNILMDHRGWLAGFVLKAAMERNKKLCCVLEEV